MRNLNKNSFRYLCVYGNFYQLVTQDRRRKHNVVTGRVTLKWGLTPERAAKELGVKIIVRVKPKMCFPNYP